MQLRLCARGIRWQQSRRKHLSYGIDEACRHRDGISCFGRGNRSGRGTNHIVRSGLELISGAEEGNEVTTDTRLASRQSGKFAANTSMCLCYLASLLEDICLGSVEYCKVGFTRRNMGQR